MVSQSDRYSWKDGPSTPEQSGEKVQGKLPELQEYISTGLYVITLGNPQKACRYFGICKIDKWEDGMEVNFSSQCLAEFATKSKPANYVRGVFIKKVLSEEIRSTYFKKEFIVEAPYLFDRLPNGKGGFLEVEIMPGTYPIEEMENGLVVYFNISQK